MNINRGENKYGCTYGLPAQNVLMDDKKTHAVTNLQHFILRKPKFVIRYEWNTGKMLCLLANFYPNFIGLLLATRGKLICGIDKTWVGTFQLTFSNT